MLNKKEFDNIRKELQEFDEEREKMIIVSREIIKLSKLIIYACHRNDVKTVSKLIDDIKIKIKRLSNKDYDMGLNNVAFQEYVEAITFFEFVKNNKVPDYKELNVNIEEYLSGLADLTGELGRKAVHDAIKKDFKNVVKIKDLVEEIFGEFLKFDLRNGELRKKSDAIKWNLNKLEDLVLSLKI